MPPTPERAAADRIKKALADNGNTRNASRTVETDDDGNEYTVIEHVGVKAGDVAAVARAIPEGKRSQKVKDLLKGSSARTVPPHTVVGIQADDAYHLLDEADTHFPAPPEAEPPPGAGGAPEAPPPQPPRREGEAPPETFRG